jgi:hypothetical protein
LREIVLQAFIGYEIQSTWQIFPGGISQGGALVKIIARLNKENNNS